MSRIFNVGAACAVLAALIATPGATCSTFASSASGDAILGRNSDVVRPLPGLLIVNKRGIEKTALSWGVVGPGAPDQPLAHWVSRYGSVTMTAIGRELPDGGMNEKGLAIEEMTLVESVLPKGHGRPTLSQSQWIQYQLDNYATVDEVVAHLDDFDITGWGWHFTVGDASGNCAAIEFLDGKPVVTRGDRGKPCVQTNSTQAASRTYLASLGDKPAPTNTDSLPRFARLSRDLIVRDDKDTDKISQAFGFLADVSAGKYTVRTTVHDMTDRTIYFRTVDHPDIKYVRLSELDFSPKSPVMMLDIEAPEHGDVTAHFSPYTEAADLSVVKSFFNVVVQPIKAGQAMLDHELADAHMTEDQYIERLAAYPASTLPAT